MISLKKKPIRNVFESKRDGTKLWNEIGLRMHSKYILISLHTRRGEMPGFCYLFECFSFAPKRAHYIQKMNWENVQTREERNDEKKTYFCLQPHTVICSNNKAYTMECARSCIDAKQRKTRNWKFAIALWCCYRCCYCCCFLSKFDFFLLLFWLFL